MNKILLGSKTIIKDQFKVDLLDCEYEDLASLSSLIRGDFKPLKVNPVNSLFFNKIGNRKKDVLFRDYLHNNSFALIVSERVKIFFEQEKVPNVEFMPVRCFNENDEVAKKMFFLQPLVVLDCIHTGYTYGDYYSNDCTSYESIDKLILDESKIPKKPSIFMLAKLHNIIVINESLFHKMNEENFDGLDYIDTSKFRVRDRYDNRFIKIKGPTGKEYLDWFKDSKELLFKKQYHKAIESFQKVIDWMEQSRMTDLEEYTDSLMNIALCYHHDIDEPDKAMEIYEKLTTHYSNNIPHMHIILPTGIDKFVVSMEGYVDLKLETKMNVEEMVEKLISWFAFTLRQASVSSETEMYAPRRNCLAVIDKFLKHLKNNGMYPSKFEEAKNSFERIMDDKTFSTLVE